jgi:hypothetical protein
LGRLLPANAFFAKQSQIPLFHFARPAFHRKVGK